MLEFAKSYDRLEVSVTLSMLGQDHSAVAK
jgi:hypothetical protein